MIELAPQRELPEAVADTLELDVVII